MSVPLLRCTTKTYVGKQKYGSKADASRKEHKDEKKIRNSGERVDVER